MENYLKLSPKDVMATHGQSFFWASWFFSPKRFENISALYTFCRYVDDCADELEAPLAKCRLKALYQHLKEEMDSPEKDYLTPLREKGVAKEYLLELVEGALFDADGKYVENRSDLLVYCYRVAGVVGLMMCPLIGVKKNLANSFAVDLGIAMQLTNICRDVLEDAKNKRYYLPLEDNLSQEQLEVQGETPKQLKKLVESYLNLADTYYESGLQGLSFIPFRPRLAILVAATLYQSIGIKIRRNGYNVLKGRTYLRKIEKMLATLKAFLHLFTKKFWFKAKHKVILHKELQNLPGIL